MKITYFWFGLALLLMAVETFAPGAFMLWFGFAAAAMGVVVLFAPGLSALVQAILFAVFSLISIQIYRTWFQHREPRSDQPLLNRRVDQMIGRTYPLHEAIVNGFGKIRVNDALWTTRGADMPVGTRVTVTAADGLTLDVRQAAVE